jgi:hypothetical protein
MVNNTMSALTYSAANATNTTTVGKCDPVTEFWEYVLLLLYSYK